MIYVNSGTPTPELPMVVYDNIWPTGVITADSQTPDGLAINTAVEGTYNYWIPSTIVAGYLNLYCNLPVESTCNAFAIVGHNYFSKGVTSCRLFYYQVGVGYVLIREIIPVDDNPILCVFPDVTSDQWVLQIYGTTIPSTSVVFLGNRLVIPGGVKAPYTPVWQADRVELMNSSSMGGKFITNRAVKRGKETMISLTSVTRSFAENDLNAFRLKFNEGGPFIWASGPSIFPKDVGYCWRKGGEMRPTFDQDAIWMALEMDVSADAS